MEEKIVGHQAFCTIGLAEPLGLILWLASCVLVSQGRRPRQSSSHDHPVVMTTYLVLHELSAPSTDTSVAAGVPAGE